MEQTSVSFHVDGGRDGRIVVFGRSHVHIISSHDDVGNLPLWVGGEPFMIHSRFTGENDLVGRVGPRAEDQGAELSVEGIKF